MAAEPDAVSDQEKCSRALDAALSVAMEHCGGSDQIESQLGNLLGVEPDPDAEAALEEGLNEETCTDFRGVRQWVLARAHEIIDKQEMSFGDAVSQAWDEAQAECAEMGHPI